MKFTFKQHEIYMANASPNARELNVKYIPLAFAGSVRRRFGSVRGRIRSTRLFRYQHVGIGKLQNRLIGGLNKCETPTQRGSHCGGI